MFRKRSREGAFSVDEKVWDMAKILEMMAILNTLTVVGARLMRYGNEAVMKWCEGEEGRGKGDGEGRKRLLWREQFCG